MIPQVLWVKKIRNNNFLLFLVSLDVLVGMWLERFIIVIVSLTRDFVNSAFGIYHPTQFDWAILCGTLGFFAACMFLFLRVLPAVSISELKMLLPSGASDSERRDGGASVKKNDASHLRRDGGIRQRRMMPLSRRRRTYGAGYRKMDAYAPFPVEELSEAIGFHHNGVALVCLIGGLLGGTAAFTFAVVDQ